MNKEFSIFKIYNQLGEEVVYKRFKDSNYLVFLTKIEQLFVEDINQLHNNKLYFHRSSRTDESEFFILSYRENETFDPKTNQYPDGTICFGTFWNWSTPNGHGRRLRSLIGKERLNKTNGKGFKKGINHRCFAFYHKAVDQWIELPNFAIYEMCHGSSKTVLSVYNYPLPGSPDVDEDILRACERYIKSEGEWTFAMDFNEIAEVISYSYILSYSLSFNSYSVCASYYNSTVDNNCEYTESCMDYDSWGFSNLLEFFNDGTVPYQVKECLIDDAFNWAEDNPVEDDEDEDQD